MNSEKKYRSISEIHSLMSKGASHKNIENKMTKFVDEFGLINSNNIALEFSNRFEEYKDLINFMSNECIKDIVDYAYIYNNVDALAYIFVQFRDEDLNLECIERLYNRVDRDNIAQEMMEKVAKLDAQMILNHINIDEKSVTKKKRM